MVNLRQLVLCGKNVLSVALPHNIIPISFEIFVLFVNSLAMYSNISGAASSTEEEKEILQCFEKLGSLENEGNSSGSLEIFTKHTGKLLEKLAVGHNMWNKHSPQRLVFEALLYHCGPVLGKHLGVAINLLIENLQPEKDAEMRLSLFNLLSKLSTRANETLNSNGEFSLHALNIVKSGIIPNCIWKPGRTAEGIRLSAVSCLWAIMVQSDLLSTEHLDILKEHILTQLMSLLTDDLRNTRLVTIRVLKVLFVKIGTKFGQEKLHSLYVDLLKRFDDINDDIRLALADAFKAYICCFDEPYDTCLYAAHIEFIFDTLLIHLDDPNEKIQQAICEVLISCSRLNPVLLAKRIEQVRPKHRHAKYLDEIAQFLKR